jgi:hypothetical protein
MEGYDSNSDTPEALENRASYDIPEQNAANNLEDVPKYAKTPGEGVEVVSP